jgi:hypothetical protein
VASSAALSRSLSLEPKLPKSHRCAHLLAKSCSARPAFAAEDLADRLKFRPPRGRCRRWRVAERPHGFRHAAGRTTRPACGRACDAAPCQPARAPCRIARRHRAFRHGLQDPADCRSPWAARGKGRQSLNGKHGRNRIAIDGIERLGCMGHGVERARHRHPTGNVRTSSAS